MMLAAYFCLSGFMPTELTKHHEEGFVFQEAPVEDILQGSYNQLDSEVIGLLRNSVDRMPWRLYIHQPYSVGYLLQTRTDPYQTHFIDMVQR